MAQVGSYATEKDISKSEALRRAWDLFMATRLRERHAPEFGGD
jgi:hypothetical protein